MLHRGGAAKLAGVLVCATALASGCAAHSPEGSGGAGSGGGAGSVASGGQGGSAPGNGVDGGGNAGARSAGGAPGSNGGASGGSSGGAAGTTGAAGSSNGSGAGSDAGAGGGGTDAGTDSGVHGGATCGSSRCQAGQSCVNGQCVLEGCVGAQVPGDYSSVQAAVDALWKVGGTICVGAGTFGDVTIDPDTTTFGPLTIQGRSAAQTTLQSLTAYNPEDFKLRGVSVVGKLTVSSLQDKGVADVSECVISGGVSVSAGFNSTGLTMTMDACDISGQPVDLSQNQSASLQFTLTNSYIHDSDGGIDDGYTGVDELDLLNDTFVNDKTALLISGPVNCFNDLLVDNQLAISLYRVTIGQAFGNNALFGNTTNYDMAMDGPGYVKSDPELDGATPPGLLPGSPCRGAADPAHAPKADYWGVPRGAKPDIGAVQAP